MKRTFLSYTLTLAMMLMGLGLSFAQEADEVGAEETTEAVADSNGQAEEAAAAIEPVKELKMEATDASTDGEAGAAEEAGLHQAIKQKFIDGGPFFMAIVLICLILGLALSIERILYLNMASTNTGKLLEEVESALQSDGVEAAKEICRNTRGPVASIFFQGLERADHGIEMVEKSVVSYGSVQMGLMEKGLSWISLFIALAPMLGFFGTVIGMIGAFDAIAAANNISPGIVASGIGVALITTVSGLLVAMVLQVFYNYIVAKVDSIVNEMEDASISLIDIMIKHQMTK